MDITLNRVAAVYGGVQPLSYGNSFPLNQQPLCQKITRTEKPLGHCTTLSHFMFYNSMITLVPPDSLSCDRDVAVYVFDINKPSLPSPFHPVLVSTLVFKALSTVFPTINSPDNTPLSHSVLPVLFLPYWSFHGYKYIYLKT